MAESSYRVSRKKGFTVVYRSVAQDKRLSLKARGLFLLMQSLPENFVLSQSRLAALAGVGRDQIRAALKELETVGYLVTEQTHNDRGKFARTDYILQEEAPDAPPPLSENPTTASPEKAPLSGNPSTGKPSAENPTVLDNIIYKETPLPPQGDGACLSEKPKAKGRPLWKEERFEAFWKFYRSNASGRPVGSRYAAALAWDKLKPDDNAINLMGIALMRQVKGEMWRRGVGVPYASTWINQRRWEDDSPDAPDSPPPAATGWKHAGG